MVTFHSLTHSLSGHSVLVVCLCFPRDSSLQIKRREEEKMFSIIVITLIAVTNIQLMEIKCLPGVEKLFQEKGSVLSLSPSNGNELKVSNLLESNLVRDIIDRTRGEDREDGDKSKSSQQQQQQQQQPNNPAASTSRASEGIHFHSTKDKQDSFRKLTWTLLMNVSSTLRLTWFTR